MCCIPCSRAPRRPAHPGLQGGRVARGRAPDQLHLALLQARSQPPVLHQQQGQHQQPVRIRGNACRSWRDPHLKRFSELRRGTFRIFPLGYPHAHGYPSPFCFG